MFQFLSDKKKIALFLKQNRFIWLTQENHIYKMPHCAIIPFCGWRRKHFENWIEITMDLVLRVCVRVCVCVSEQDLNSFHFLRRNEKVGWCFPQTMLVNSFALLGFWTDFMNAHCGNNLHFHTCLGSADSATSVYKIWRPHLAAFKLMVLLHKILNTIQSFYFIRWFFSWLSLHLRLVSISLKKSL